MSINAQQPRPQMAPPAAEIQAAYINAEATTKAARMNLIGSIIGPLLPALIGLLLALYFATAHTQATPQPPSVSTISEPTASHAPPASRDRQITPVIKPTAPPKTINATPSR